MEFATYCLFMATIVFARQWPHSRNLQPQFMNKLFNMWFEEYKDRSGFQHTFVGEKVHYDWQNYKGFHNWYQFKLQQAIANRINLNVNQVRFNGDLEPPFLPNLSFDWNGYSKENYGVSRMFVGTSPAFEIALFSVCFIQYAGQPCSCNIGRSTVTVQTYGAGGHNQQIATAFPTDVYIKVGRCNERDKRTNCGWPGITQQECLDRGCCYKNMQPNAKRCFFPKDHKCDVINPNDRKECGHSEITRQTCEDTNNCCYDNLVPNVPFCFKGSI